MGGRLKCETTVICKCICDCVETKKKLETKGEELFHSIVEGSKAIKVGGRIAIVLEREAKMFLM